MSLLWKRHGMQDRDQIAKTYLTEGGSSELNAGGKLNPEQQLQVYNAIRAQSTLLGPRMGGQAPAVAPGYATPESSAPGMPEGSALDGRMPGAPQTTAVGGPGIDFINVTNGRMTGTVEGFLRSGHIVKPATQATHLHGPRTSILKPRARNWELKKFGLEQEWSTEETFQTVYEDRLSEFLMSAIFPIAVNDLELMALHGDEDIVPDGSDPLDDILAINDGWLKHMRQESPKVDQKGAFPDENFFYAMLRQMPDLYQPLMKYWFAHNKVSLDWRQYLTTRGPGAYVADMALGGRGLAPCGIQFWDVPLLKIDEPVVQSAAATPARVISTNFDMFRFPTDAYSFSLNVDGAGAVVITFPTVEAAMRQDKTVTTARAVQIINDALVAAHGIAYSGIARIGQGGRLELLSSTAGAGSSLVLAATSVNALPVLGFPAGTITGVAALGGGVTYNGTSVFLANPTNLQMRVSTAAIGTNAAGFRQYLKYRQSQDTTRYNAWGFVDYTLGAPEGIILGQNVRVARPGEIPGN